MKARRYALSRARIWDVTTLTRIGEFVQTWGESLRWDDRRDRLYLVDCATQQLHWLDGAEPPLHSMRLPSMPGGVVLTGGDRLPDPACATAVGQGSIGELTPGGNDPGGVCAKVVHVGEGDPDGGASERLPQQVDLGRADRDKHRLLGLETILDEPRHSSHELVLACVEQCLVAKAAAVHVRRVEERRSQSSVTLAHPRDCRIGVG